MRKERDVNVHRTQYREHANSNGAKIRVPRLLEAAEAPLYQPPYWWEKFLPRRETRLMSEEANRSGGLFLPYPLLGIMMTLILALGGGIIGLYSQLSAMNATMLMRDADYRKTVDKLEDKLELQDVVINNTREKLVEMRTELNQFQKKGSN